ncbi:hypothetical protein DSBG_0975 [Desulfosporosinus sp. BG]|nr:hypothetical protein DSBG_0975 [Desulfosporosinus sp. BG]
MPLSQGEGKEYSYSDYLTWQEDERWEITFQLNPAKSILRHFV